MRIKIAFFLVILLAVKSNCLLGQTLAGYFENRGVYNLCQAAHVSNDYIAGEYTINSNNVRVAFKSKDNVFGGTIYTSLTIKRGFGDLYFSDIIVNSDNDMIPPFDAFGLQANLLTALMKSIDEKTYNEMRQAVIDNFDTDIDHWSGKMWALLALNLDYYDYVLGN